MHHVCTCPHTVSESSICLIDCRSLKEDVVTDSAPSLLLGQQLLRVLHERAHTNSSIDGPRCFFAVHLCFCVLDIQDNCDGDTLSCASKPADSLVLLSQHELQMCQLNSALGTAEPAAKTPNSSKSWGMWAHIVTLLAGSDISGSEHRLRTHAGRKCGFAAVLLF